MLQKHNRKIVIEETSKENPENTPDSLWEIFKFNIALFCQEQSISIARERNKVLNDLEVQLEKAIDEQSYSLNPTTEQQTIIMEKIEEIYLEKTKSSIFRSKCTCRR